MSSASNIEWTDATWNPIVGCTIVSPGCTNCYAMRMAARINKMTLSSHYEGLTKKVNGKVVWTGKIARAPDYIFTSPLRWKKPRRIFVNSMGDLFHESIPDSDIDAAFAVMALCPQHTFQVLTKRAERMLAYLSHADVWKRIAKAAALDDLLGLPLAVDFWSVLGVLLTEFPSKDPGHPTSEQWPLPNVWLGISCERQQEADERIPLLLQTPAAVRFISAEPLLGAIDLQSPGYTGFAGDGGPSGQPHLEWVIVGGESGPNARPMHPDWARSIRDQCEAAGVPYFFKQWGEWKDGSDFAADSSVKAVMNDGRVSDPDLTSLTEHDRIYSISVRNPTLMRKVGKKSAGRLLDGREHNDMPGRVE